MFGGWNLTSNKFLTGSFEQTPRNPKQVKSTAGVDGGVRSKGPVSNFLDY